jgi:hypothetical protein
LAHASAASSAAGLGAADLGVSGGEVILVGRLLVVPPVAPGVVVVPPGRPGFVELLPVVSAAAPDGRSFEPVSWGTMMPMAMTRTATTHATIVRWRGERMGQPHRRR